jgi:hypothetical protein
MAWIVAGYIAQASITSRAQAARRQIRKGRMADSSRPFRSFNYALFVRFTFGLPYRYLLSLAPLRPGVPPELYLPALYHPAPVRSSSLAPRMTLSSSTELQKAIPSARPPKGPEAEFRMALLAPLIAPRSSEVAPLPPSESPPLAPAAPLPAVAPPPFSPSSRLPSPAPCPENPETAPVSER